MFQIIIELQTSKEFSRNNNIKKTKSVKRSHCPTTAVQGILCPRLCSDVRVLSVLAYGM